MSRSEYIVRLLAEAVALAGFLFFVIQTLAVIAPERIY